MPRAKTRKATLADVKAKQARRSKRARAADAAGTAKSTYGQQNRDGLGRWMKSPRRHDVAGIDTKGAGKAPRTVSLRSLVRRTKKRAKRK